MMLDMALTLLVLGVGVFAAFRNRRFKRLRLASERQYIEMLENSSDGILLCGQRGAIHYVNPKLVAMSGYVPEELVGQSVELLVPDGLRERHRGFRQAYNAAPRLRDMEQCGDISLLRKDGGQLPVNISLLPWRDERGLVVTAIVRDMTERKRHEEQLTWFVTHDALTGLPNRNLLEDRLKQAIAHVDRSGKTLAFLYLDLDNFKVINDSLGHDAGDLLLQEIGARLTGALRDGDTVARLGGDEFVVMLVDLARPEDARFMAENLIAAIAAPCRLMEEEAVAHVSVGIALYPRDGADFLTLMKHADMAMYRAKETGRGRCQFFEESMNEAALARFEREHALRQALEKGEFVLHYQPKQDLTSGYVGSVEALLRWNHPGEGLVSPGIFIPVLEDSGLIVDVGAWVLREACGQAKRWLDAGTPLCVAVNLSPKQFGRGDIGQTLAAALSEAALDSRWLELEITESVMMHDTEEVLKQLSCFRQMGLHLSVDDFGTGYSSLSYLKRFPVGTVKIDRAFIRDLPQDDNDAALSRAIIVMAHSLGLQVVAEGVETEEQREFLLWHGCNAIQGYLLSAPLPAEELTAWLARRAGSDFLRAHGAPPVPGIK
jgi:diguanylate cyclase (GGDEF)-like protein/PAS domain S-box-containing protein